MRKRLPLGLYVALVGSAAATFAVGGWWRLVAVVMAGVGVGCWLWERRHVPRVAPLVLVVLLLVPFVSACGGIPPHPQPIAIETLAPSADGWCVVAVSSTGVGAIYTFASVPLDWVGVFVFGTGLPGLSSCWSEFDANRFTLRVWYTCGQEAHYFIAKDVNWIADQFHKAHCGNDGYYIPWVSFF
jgi:hypothetical protein